MTGKIQTQCCIAGGGPAGMMLGFLLARMGVDVYVLEKHADFLRDFRGDTIHPSTLEIMHELGMLDEFLTLPHQEVKELGGQVSGEFVTIADFTHLPTHCKFLALMPQWDFLNFIAKKAQAYPAFHLLMEAEVTGISEQNGCVSGVHVKTPGGAIDVHARLVVGADGRHSLVRQQAKLEVINRGAPMDVLWLRLRRQPTDPGQTFGIIETGKIFVMLDRETYWQCGFVVAKGSAEQVKNAGIEKFREDITALAPFLSDRIEELRDWNDTSLLTVTVDCLRRWSRPGLLCIGDAAHAMSPIGGVGINLAIQDAVASANILGQKLLQGTPRGQELAAVQRRRAFPTNATQQMQVFVQNRVIKNVLTRAKPLRLPWLLKLLLSWPFLRRIPARVVGVGLRPEHIHTPEAGLT